MKKKVISVILLTALISGSLVGCNKNNLTTIKTVNEKVEDSNSKNDKVTLNMYCEKDTFDLVNEMIDGFKKENSNTTFEINLIDHNDADMKNDVLRDVNADFDLFTFPDDQFDSLNASGVLSEVPNSDEIKNRNIEVASECATYNNKLYAYPFTADNGYFLYYDKSYFNDNDLKTLDGILAVCNANNKDFSMELDSGWYMYAFYGQTGLDFGINDDGLTNHCNWNSNDGNVKGIDVAKAIKKVVDNPSYKNYKDDELWEGFNNKSVIAGVSGTWSATNIQKALGNNYGAIKLPTYTCGNSQIQMSTFTGYKMIGVNAYSKNKEWAHKLADYLTNKDSQMIRLTKASQGPSNIEASNSNEVKQNQAISAILDESQYGNIQRVGNSYWNACTNFYNSLNAKSYTDTELQELLDTMVTKITKSVGN